MPSRTDPVLPAKTPVRLAQDRVNVWNRKGHYYLGLFFLLFLWLFAFTGLLLNHSSWAFADFWPSRKVSTLERRIEGPGSGSDLDRARDVMQQLGIAGEIEWTASKPGSTEFQFRVNRPGHNFNVVVHPGHDRAAVELTEVNTWGIARALHTFTGGRAGDKRNDRDWVLTTVWVLSMDAVSGGLVLMVLSGLYMWYRLPAKRIPGVVALLLGTVICGVFVFILPWINS